MKNFQKQALIHITSEVFENMNLNTFTTFGIGGPADLAIIMSSTQQLMDILQICNNKAIPHKLIGAGSNVVISDEGFRGLIIINKSDSWEVTSGNHSPVHMKKPGKPLARLSAVGEHFYTTDGLDYEDPDEKRVLVKAASGVRIIPFIKALFQKEITGLQWFSGIPASVGGAIYMNMHGGEYFFGDFVYSALLYDDKKLKSVDHDYFKFGYDWSILHDTGEVIIEADLLLHKGDVAKAKSLSVDWARRKSLQPQRSAGCVFQNLTQEQQKKLDLPTPSIGYLVDKVLGLKGTRKGNAIISEKHAAFIENLGDAKARDVYYLYQLIKAKAMEKYNLELKPEIEFIGHF